MIALNQALYNKLKGDAALIALLAAGTASIFQRLAPENETTPYCIYQQQAGVAAYTLAGPSWTDFVFTVKGITEGPSMQRAGQIQDRLEELLTNGELTVAGRDHLYLRREADVEYAEVVDGRRYNHAGADFRIWVA